MYSTAYNLWTFTWFVHFELPFRLKGTDKINTEGLSKFHSNIYSILFECSILVTWYRQRHVTTLLHYHWWEFWWRNIYLNFRFWYSFISISRDRNIRYNFHGSQSRAKEISFQPILPSIFPLCSPFNWNFHSLVWVLKHCVQKQGVECGGRGTTNQRRV